MNDIVDRLLNWKDETIVMEVRQTADDIQKLMTEAAELIEYLRGIIGTQDMVICGLENRKYE